MPNSYRRSQFAFGLALLSIAGFFLPIHLAAQSGAGAISGAVRDPSGAVVPRAAVTVLNAGLIKPALVNHTPQESQNGQVQAEE